jgi:hypothetical protein
MHTGPFSNKPKPECVGPEYRLLRCGINSKYPEKTINSINNSANFVEFYINGPNSSSFNLDTGADVSLIKLKQVPLDVEIVKRIITIKGVTSGSIHTLGIAKINIHYNSQFFPKTFHVVPNSFPIPSDGLIGIDFITKYNAILDYNTWTFCLTKNGITTKLPIVNHIHNVFIIPPRCNSKSRS